MSSSSPVWRVDLEIRPSRIFFAISSALHVLAVLAVLHSALTFSLQLALSLCVLLSLIHGWRKERVKIRAIVREREDGWWLQSGRRSGVAALGGCKVWRFLVVMDFRGRDQNGRVWRQRVVMLPDSIPADAFRRLRIRLQYGRRLNPVTDSAQRFLQ